MSQLYRNALIGVILGAGLFLFPFMAKAQIAVPTEEVEKILAIRDVTVKENRLLGEITNNSPLKVRDISLMVQHTLRSKDGLNPKVESPLNAFLLPLDRELLPGETVTFSSTVSIPEEARADGEIVTDVTVAAFTLVVPKNSTAAIPINYKY
jgi:hypothetical protein